MVVYPQFFGIVNHYYSVSDNYTHQRNHSQSSCQPHLLTHNDNAQCSSKHREQQGEHYEQRHLYVFEMEQQDGEDDNDGYGKTVIYLRAVFLIAGSLSACLHCNTLRHLYRRESFKCLVGNTVEVDVSSRISVNGDSAHTVSSYYHTFVPVWLYNSYLAQFDVDSWYYP